MTALDRLVAVMRNDHKAHHYGYNVAEQRNYTPEECQKEICRTLSDLERERGVAVAWRATPPADEASLDRFKLRLTDDSQYAYKLASAGWNVQPLYAAPPATVPVAAVERLSGWAEHLSRCNVSLAEARHDKTPTECDCGLDAALRECGMEGR